MWNRAKIVLMTIILVAVSLAVYFTIYLKTYTPASKQWNPASFQYERFGTARNGMGSMGTLIPAVTSPLHFEMSEPGTIFEYRFRINLTSSTKVQFKFQATAPVYFLIESEYGRLITSGIPVTSMESEFSVKNSGSYVFEFEPVQSNPDATVTFDARLDC